MKCESDDDGYNANDAINSMRMVSLRYNEEETTTMTRMTTMMVMVMMQLSPFIKRGCIDCACDFSAVSQLHTATHMKAPQHNAILLPSSSNGDCKG